MSDFDAVIVVTGAGGMGCAVVRRIGTDLLVDGGVVASVRIPPS